MRKRPRENGIVTAAGQTNTYENRAIGEIFRGDFQIHRITAVTSVEGRAAHRTAGLPARQHRIEVPHPPVVNERIRRTWNKDDSLLIKHFNQQSSIHNHLSLSIYYVL